MRRLGIFAATVAVLAISLCAARPTSVLAAEKLGVVLIHGKEGMPGQMQGLVTALNAAGYLAERPEMCWSRRRIYDRAYLDCFADIDFTVKKLKAEGATSIVIAGMSLGGNAAVGYGARHEGLKGIIALAPAPAIEFISKLPAIAKSLAEAQSMIATGRGNDKATFADINTGRPFEVETTAKIYVSFFAPDSPGVLPDNAAKLKAPLLIVSGQLDPTQRSVPYAFARAPSNGLNWHVTVASDHRGTPAAARDVVLAWLKILAGQ